MKVLVCGGRDYHDRQFMFAKLDEVAADAMVVIHGDARGADQIAGEWARARRKAVVAYPADWAAHGKGAGPIRNQQMLDLARPDLVVAFPGNSGTRDMMDRAEKADVRLVVAS